MTIGDFETSARESWGINGPSCQPAGSVEEPVVLIYGTSGNATTWSELVPVPKIGHVRVGIRLWRRGRDAAERGSLAQGDGGLDDSAEEVAPKSIMCGRPPVLSE